MGEAGHRLRAVWCELLSTERARVGPCFLTQEQRSAACLAALSSRACRHEGRLHCPPAGPAAHLELWREALADPRRQQVELQVRLPPPNGLQQLGRVLQVCGVGGGTVGVASQLPLNLPRTARRARQPGGQACTDPLDGLPAGPAPSPHTPTHTSPPPPPPPLTHTTPPNTHTHTYTCTHTRAATRSAAQASAMPPPRPALA